MNRRGWVPRWTRHEVRRSRRTEVDTAARWPAALRRALELRAGERVNRLLVRGLLLAGLVFVLFKVVPVVGQSLDGFPVVARIPVILISGFVLGRVAFSILRGDVVEQVATSARVSSPRTVAFRWSWFPPEARTDLVRLDRESPDSPEHVMAGRVCAAWHQARRRIRAGGSAEPLALQVQQVVHVLRLAGRARRNPAVWSTSSDASKALTGVEDLVQRLDRAGRSTSPATERGLA